MFKLLASLLLTTSFAAQRSSWESALNGLQRLEDDINTNFGRGLNLRISQLQTSLDGLTNAEILQLGDDLSVQEFSSLVNSVNITSGPYTVPPLVYNCDFINGPRDCSGNLYEPGYGAGGSYDAIKTLGLVSGDDSSRSDADEQAALQISYDSLNLANTVVDYVCEALPDDFGADSICWAGAAATGTARDTIGLIIGAAGFVDGAVDSAEIEAVYENSLIISVQIDSLHNEILALDEQQEKIGFLNSLLSNGGASNPLFYLPAPYGYLERVIQEVELIYQHHVDLGLPYNKATMWLSECQDLYNQGLYKDSFKSCSTVIQRLG
jgi:hypothetical protein